MERLFWFYKGYYASTKKTVPIHYQKPQSDGSIMPAMPMWAGAFPPAVRKFIEKIGKEPITLIVSSGGSIPKDREGFIKVIDAAGKNVLGNI